MYLFVYSRCGKDAKEMCDVGYKRIAQKTCLKLQGEIELSHNSLLKQKYNIEKLAGKCYITLCI